MSATALAAFCAFFPHLRAEANDVCYNRVVSCGDGRSDCTYVPEFRGHAPAHELARTAVPRDITVKRPGWIAGLRNWPT